MALKLSFDKGFTKEYQEEIRKDLNTLLWGVNPKNTTLEISHGANALSPAEIQERDSRRINVMPKNVERVSYDLNHTGELFENTLKNCYAEVYKATNQKNPRTYILHKRQIRDLA